MNDICVSYVRNGKDVPIWWPNRTARPLFIGSIPIDTSKSLKHFLRQSTSLVHPEIVVGDAIQSQTIFPRTKRHSRLHPIPLGRVWSISYLFQACWYDAILWYLEDRKPAWTPGNSDFSPIRARFKLEQIHI